MIGFNVLGFLISWATFLGIYSILSISLNLEVGFTGIVNFGKVAFYAIGAYIAATVSTYTILMLYNIRAAPYTTEGIIALGKYEYLNPFLDAGLFLLAIVLGFAISGIVGYLLTYPVLRVGPEFVGMTLLAFGELLRIFFQNYQPAGGSKGLMSIPHPLGWLRTPLIKDGLYTLIVLGFLVLIYLYSQKLVNSPFGRLLKAVRDDEVAALCLGKHVPRVKATILFISSGFAGIAGVLMAFYLSAINPNMFMAVVTFNIWGMVILGGMANNLGAIVGAAILTFIDRALTFVTPNLGITIITPDYIRWMSIGLLITLVLLFWPRGMVPEKPVETPPLKLIKKRGDRNEHNA